MNSTKMIFALSMLIAAQAYAADSCQYINKHLAGSYNVTLNKHDESKLKVGKVSFAKTSHPKIFKATNLQAIGDILLPGAPKMIRLEDAGNECLLIGVGRIESNTLGAIIAGDKLKVFAIQVEDTDFESISFVKVK